ncbi:MAG: nitroreductase family protein [Proteobacteria bacterium]|nr:nitroreductase family protein [Pseudomonadota bacterium]
MFMSLIRNRRSIRSFSDKEIEPEKIALLIEAALRSPSSRSLNPWEFVLVRDKGMLDQLSSSKPHGATFLKHAPLGIVVLADPKKCDVWVEDASIASTYIQLAAENLGLTSCWIQIRNREFGPGKMACEQVADLLNIPAHIEVESIIAIGYPVDSLPGHPKESLDYTKVHDGIYGKNFS